MNLLYLPTIIGLIIKYGPYVAQADAVLKQFGPLVQQLAGALVPVVEKNFGVLKAEAPADIVARDCCRSRPSTPFRTSRTCSPIA